MAAGPLALRRPRRLSAGKTTLSWSSEGCVSGRLCHHPRLRAEACQGASRVPYPLPQRASLGRARKQRRAVFRVVVGRLPLRGAASGHGCWDGACSPRAEVTVFQAGRRHIRPPGFRPASRRQETTGSQLLCGTPRPPGRPHTPTSASSRAASMPVTSSLCGVPRSGLEASFPILGWAAPALPRGQRLPPGRLLPPADTHPCLGGRRGLI